eukprot:358307-Chlamydomonas_euryale.AAC.1
MPYIAISWRPVHVRMGASCRAHVVEEVVHGRSRARQPRCVGVGACDEAGHGAHGLGKERRACNDDEDRNGLLEHAHGRDATVADGLHGHDAPVQRKDAALHVRRVGRVGVVVAHQVGAPHRSVVVKVLQSSREVEEARASMQHANHQQHQLSQAHQALAQAALMRCEGEAHVHVGHGARDDAEDAQNCGAGAGRYHARAGVMGWLIGRRGHFREESSTEAMCVGYYNSGRLSLR